LSQVGDAFIDPFGGFYHAVVFEKMAYRLLIYSIKSKDRIYGHNPI
jgi:hypothetical protein